MLDKIVEEKDSSNSPLLKKVILAFEKPEPEIIEKYQDREPWVQEQMAGKVHIRPPMDDKKIMVSLYTPDLELYELFNDAASRITREWGGFHQIGAGEENGLSGWELWKKPTIPNQEILEKVKNEMLREVTMRIKWS